MNEPVRIDSASPAGNEPPRHCTYCGAELDPSVYFCPRCATPYKAVESVLPASLPIHLTTGDVIRKKAPHVSTLFWTYFSVVVGAALLSILAFGEDQFLLTLVIQSAALLVTTCIFAARHWPSLAVQFKRFGLLRPETAVSIIALGALLGLNYLYHSWILDQMGMEETALDRAIRQANLGTGTVILYLCVFPAVLEEIAFRGLLQHWLRLAVRPLLALTIASALFAVMHFTVISAPYLFLAGMLFGWVKWRTGSLYPPILLHFLHNYIVLEFF